MIFHCIGKDMVLLHAERLAFSYQNACKGNFKPLKAHENSRPLGEAKNAVRYSEGGELWKLLEILSFLPTHLKFWEGREKALGWVLTLLSPTPTRPVNKAWLLESLLKRREVLISFLLPFPAFFNSLLSHFSPQGIGRTLPRSTSYGKECGSRRNKKGMKSEEVMPTSREWPARKHGTAV